MKNFFACVTVLAATFGLGAAISDAGSFGSSQGGPGSAQGGGGSGSTPNLTTVMATAPNPGVTGGTSLTLTDGDNVISGSSTGTKVGTATTQKLGFWNAAPVVQTAGNTDVLAGLVTVGLRAASANPPLNLGSGTVTAGTYTSTVNTTITAAQNVVVTVPATKTFSMGTGSSSYTSRFDILAGTTSGTLGPNNFTVAASDGGTNSTTVAQTFSILPTINYTGATRTGHYEALVVAATETSLPTGANLLLALRAGAAGTTDKFTVQNNGLTTITNTAETTANGLSVTRTTTTAPGALNGVLVVLGIANADGAGGAQDSGLLVTEGATAPPPSSPRGLIDLIMDSAGAGATDVHGGLYMSRASTSGGGPILFRRMRGTIAVPVVANAGDVLGRLVFAGYTAGSGDGFPHAGEINYTADAAGGTYTGSNWPGSLNFLVQPAASSGGLTTAVWSIRSTGVLTGALGTQLGFSSNADSSASTVADVGIARSTSTLLKTTNGSTGQSQFWTQNLAVGNTGSINNAGSTAASAVLTLETNGAVSGDLALLEFSHTANAAASNDYIGIIRFETGGSKATTAGITANFRGTDTDSGNLTFYTKPTGGSLAANVGVSDNAILSLASSGVIGFTSTSDGRSWVQAADTGASRLAAASWAFGNGAANDVTATLNFSAAVMGGKVTKYNGTTTAGLGVVSIVGAARVTAQSAANSSITTFTVGGSDGSFEVSMNMNVTVATALSTSMNCDYTDESNTARTMILPTTSLSGSFLTGGLVTGTGSFETPVIHIRAFHGTAIKLYTAAGTFSTVTYSAEGVIKETQ